MPEPISRLPIELLGPIFSYLGTRDLKSVTLTCKLFTEVAKPLLWNDISLTVSPKVYNQFRELQLLTKKDRQDDWHTQRIEFISKDSVGKFIKKIEIRKSSEVTDIFEPSQKLFTNLDPAKLYYIKASSHNFCSIESFGNLKALELLFSYGALHHGGYPDLPTLPSVRELTLSWHPQHRDKDVPDFSEILVTFCKYATSCRNTTKIALDLSYVGDPITNHDIQLGPNHDVVFNFMENIKFPNLSRWILILPPSFTRSIVKLRERKSGVVLVFEILFEFASRHSEQIKSLFLLDMPEGGDDEEKSKRPHSEFIPTLQNVEKLFLGCMDTWAGARLPSMTNEYLERHVGKNTQSLRHLTVNEVQLAAKWKEWVKNFIQPFSNLETLKLRRITIVMLEMPMDASKALGVGIGGKIHPIFADRNLFELADLLPPKITNLSLSWGSANGLKPKVFRDHIPAFVDFFVKNPSLNRLKLKLLCGRTYQHMIFRRRPHDYLKPIDERKSVAVWHLKSSGHGKEVTPHPELWHYSEHILPEGQYVGPDAKKWSILGKGDNYTKKFLDCTASDACAYRIHKKGYWVPLP